MKLALVALMFAAPVFANHACLQQVTNDELASEVRFRLLGGGSVQPSAPVTVNYICRDQYLYFIMTNAAGTEVRDYITATTSESCVKVAGELNRFRNKVYADRVTIAAVCRDQYLYRLKLKSDLTFNKSDYISTTSSEACTQTATQMNTQN